MFHEAGKKGEVLCWSVRLLTKSEADNLVVFCLALFCRLLAPYLSLFVTSSP